MEIEEFLKDKNEKYDFSNDGASNFYCNIKNGVEKFFAYMLKSKKESFKDDEIAKKQLEKYEYILIDPDNKSNLMQKIYKILWNVEDPNMQKCIKNKMISGETLNSANTTLGKFYKYIERNFDKGVKRHPGYIYYILYDYLNSENMEIIDKIIHSEEFEKFVRSYHTIGNFMPVPVNCNCPRGMSSKIKDYWDLTLFHIYNYYINDNYEGIRYIVNELDNDKWQESPNAKLYISWLNDYGKGKMGWKNFIESNYLKAFVKHDYFPKELWQGHFDQDSDGQIKNILPVNESQCIEYFNNATYCIYERGREMIKVLKKKINIK